MARVMRGSIGKFVHDLVPLIGIEVKTISKAWTLLFKPGGRFAGVTCELPVERLALSPMPKQAPANLS